MRSFSRLASLLSYMAIGLALCVGIYAFVQSDNHRIESQTLWNQTYRILWRETKIRERLARVQGHIRLAAEINSPDADLPKQLALLNLNVNSILELAFLPRLLPENIIKQLEDAQKIVENDLVPAVIDNSNYQAALRYTDQIGNIMHEVTSATTNRSMTLHETDQINAAASRNWLVFTAALAWIAIFFFIVTQRFNFVRQKISISAHLLRCLRTRRDRASPV